MKNVSMKLLSAMISVVLFTLSVPVHAELYMKYESRTDAYRVMGNQQPAEKSIREIWIAGNMIRVDEEEQSTILDMKNGTMTLVDHAEKTYMVLKQDDLMGSMQEAMGIQGQTEEAHMAMEMFKEMTEGMVHSLKITVKETGEKKKIGNWNATRYLVNTSMGTASSSEAEVWATEDIKVDAEVYHALSRSLMANDKGMNEVIKEMEKVKGVHVLTISTSDIMGAKVKNTEELLEVKQMSIPSDHFQIPPAYTTQ